MRLTELRKNFIRRIVIFNFIQISCVVARQSLPLLFRFVLLLLLVVCETPTGFGLWHDQINYDQIKISKLTPQNDPEVWDLKIGNRKKVEMLLCILVHMLGHSLSKAGKLFPLLLI